MLPGKCRTVVIVAGLSCPALACQVGDAPADEPGTVVVQDSAGIEIVESITPAWDGDGWRVSAEPGLVIGRMSGDERYLFGEVAGAVVLRDGRVAVVDGQAALIRVYSTDGVHIEDWGGSGEGPGEFSGRPRKIFPYRGDSILVEQFANHGSNIYDDRGRFGRAVAPEMWVRFNYDRVSLGFGPSMSAVKTCCTLWGALPNGAFLGSYSEMLPYPGSGTMRASIVAAITPESGSAPESAGVFAGGQYQFEPEGGVSDLQFQFRFSMAVGPDGYFVTEGDAYSINSYDTSGRLRRIIRLAREPRPVTDEVRAAHEARLREETSPEDEEWLRRRLAVPYPTHLPAFEWLHADSEGNLWARQRRYGADHGVAGANTYEFFVFAPDGRHLGMIELPAGLEVYQIGADFMLGKVSDEFDVDYVHLYRIEK